MTRQSVAEVFWPNGAKFPIPLALFYTPFPNDWDPFVTKNLLIEAIVAKGKGRFGGTPAADDHDRQQNQKSKRQAPPICYSHSLIYLVDRDRGVLCASFEPYYVKGPRRFSGSDLTAAMTHIEPLNVAGLEKMTSLFRIAHPAIFQQVVATVASQWRYKPKYFAVNRLTLAQHKAVQVFIEGLHHSVEPPKYQIAGYSSFNCDRFRRAARQVAGLPVSILGRLFPWPAFRAATIAFAARAEEWRLVASDTTCHYGADMAVKMLRRAYRKGFIPKPYNWRLLHPTADELALQRVREMEEREKRVSRRQFMMIAAGPIGMSVPAQNSVRPAPGCDTGRTPLMLPQGSG